MYSVAVCDDNKQDMEQAGYLASEILQELEIPHSINWYQSVEAFLTAVKQDVKFDLILLDILFEGPEGMAVAKVLRECGAESEIIFVTNSSDYMIDGYDVHALGYLIKPPDRDRMKSAILYARKRGLEREQTLTLVGKTAVLEVRLQQLLYFESFRNYIVLHYDDGTEDKWRGSMDELMTKLPPEQYYRCHKSYCVRLKQVRIIRCNEVVLRGGIQIPIGRTRYTGFRDAYIDYMNS